jgi:hypothetical protein
MRITVRFQDGAIEEFDTNTLTTDSALGRTNALTDLRLVLHDGLWIEASWYRVVSSEGSEMPLAQRSAGCRLHVLSEEEVAQARSIELDGRLQWVRVGPDLCDVSRLDEAADLFYDADEPARSMAGRAAWLHDYLRGVLASELSGPDEERLVCAKLGMTQASYEYLSGAAANVYSEDF